MELLLTGRRLPASEAAAWGLVNQVVPQVDLTEESMAVARAIRDNAPVALAADGEGQSAEADRLLLADDGLGDLGSELLVELGCGHLRAKG